MAFAIVPETGHVTLAVASAPIEPLSGVHSEIKAETVYFGFVVVVVPATGWIVTVVVVPKSGRLDDVILCFKRDRVDARGQVYTCDGDGWVSENEFRHFMQSPS